MGRKAKLCITVGMVVSFIAVSTVAFSSVIIEKQEVEQSVDFEDSVETVAEVIEDDFLSEETLSELEFEEYEAGPFYRRTIIIPEYVVIVPDLIEESVVEDEMLAPPMVDDFALIESYVRCSDGKRVPFKGSEYLQRLVYEKAEDYDIPYKVVLAILGVETNWNEDPNHTEKHDGATYYIFHKSPH